MNTSMEKASMTPDQKASLLKYLKYGLGAAVVSAGVGSAISRAKANAKRKKALKVEDSRNAIVVDIRKDKFMEGLKTPEEVALERGEDANGEPIGGSDAPAVPQIAAMSQEDIDAKKKEIKRRNGRMLSFFGDKVAESEDRKPDKSEKPKESKGRIVDNDAPRLPRDEAGRFVSPTSPIGIMQSEKDAGWRDFDWSGSAWNALAHPLKTVGSMFESGTTYPAYMTMGGVGALYLSAMIVDKINEMRAKAAEKKTQSAQQEYAKKLQEKDAQDKGYAPDTNPLSAAGMVLGASFIIPATLSAMLANKVMERRKKERDDAKRKSDSYPEEPVILYKTSEDKTIRISPETALVAIMLKRAMIESCEFEKSAGWGDWLGDTWDSTMKSVNSALGIQSNEPKENRWNKEIANTIDAFNDPNNKQAVLNLMQAYAKNPRDPTIAGMMENILPMTVKAGLGTSENKQEFKEALLSSPKFQDAIINMYDNDKDFIAHRQQMLDDELVGGPNPRFTRDGLLHKIISWFYNTFGLWKGNLRDRMNSAAKPQQAQGAATNTQQTQGAATNTQQTQGAKQQATGAQGSATPANQARYAYGFGERSLAPQTLQKLNPGMFASFVPRQGTSTSAQAKTQPSAPAAPAAQQVPVDPNSLGRDTEAAKAILKANGKPVAEPAAGTAVGDNAVARGAGRELNFFVR